MEQTEVRLMWLAGGWMVSVREGRRHGWTIGTPIGIFEQTCVLGLESPLPICCSQIGNERFPVAYFAMCRLRHSGNLRRAQLLWSE